MINDDNTLAHSVFVTCDYFLFLIFKYFFKQQRYNIIKKMEEKSGATKQDFGRRVSYILPAVEVLLVRGCSETKEVGTLKRIML